jgi:hypothetical protein
VLNPIQADYLNTLRQRYAKIAGVDAFRGIRDLIVKPRQLGFSTFIAALFFMDGYLSPGRISVVLTHKKDLSLELLRTYKTFFEELPPQLRDAVNVVGDSKYELEVEFRAPDAADAPPSRFIIATEAGEPWRGGVIHNLHASEAAWYKHWAQFKASFVQAVPRNGNVVYETTVNGFNPYYDECMAAMRGLNGYRVVFYEWFKHPEYRLPWGPEQPPLTLRAEMEPSLEEESEEAVMERFGLDLEQLAWRRWKLGELRELFPQEYPETLLGAFLTSGRPYFDMKAVSEGHAAALAYNEAHPAREPRTHVRVWEDPIPGDLYLLPADVAEGKDRGSQGHEAEQGGTDFSYAPMIHVASLRVVAAIHGRIPPVEFARILDRLGRAYEAVVAPERNNHGHTVVATLEASGYPEVYRHREYNQTTGTAFLVPGFPTTTVTRPMILDALDEVIRKRALWHPDARFWTEAHAFHRNEQGKPEALPGNHDDRVMGTAIGVYLCTLGRGGWNVAGPDGADVAGFPRHKACAPVAPLLASPSPSEPVTVHRMVDTAEVASLVQDLAGYRREEADVCGACAHCQAAVLICDHLHAKVLPGMPACDCFLPCEEDDDLSGPAGLSEDETWTL